MLHQITSALTDVWAETGFILISLALSLIAIRIGDWLADRRERIAKRRKLSQKIEAQIAEIELAKAYRQHTANNDASWARKFGGLR